jgi:ABC-type multidrug transport system ATPase subunit
MAPRAICDKVATETRCFFDSALVSYVLSPEAHSIGRPVDDLECGDSGEMAFMATTFAESNPPAARAQGSDVVLRTINLSKRYGARLAVDKLSLDVRRGEIFGFLGPNGAGKTTTIRMLLGLIAPTEGNVEILGGEVFEHRAEILPRVGALIETPALYPYLSGRDNLRAVGSVLGGAPAERIDAVLELVGLTARQKDRVRTYSLGMKQRLGVAIALLNDPDVLVLDEPANGLDPAGIVEMRDLLRRLSSEGKTVFISSHVLSEVRQICTRVAILNLGRLVTESTVEDLLRGHGEFSVRVENAEQALAIVRTQAWGQGAKLDGAGALITASPDGRGRSLNAFLSQAGYVPDALGPAEQDLEDVFLQLTGAGQGGVQ